MKKNLLLLFIATSVLFTSCGGGSGSSSSGQPSASDAGAIIDYYNTSLRELKDSYKESKMEDVLSYMSKVKTNRRAFAPVAVFASVRDSSKMLNPGKCFSQQDRDSLKAYYRTFYSSGDKFMSNYDQFKDYLKAEDFKDDNWAKGEQIRQESEQLYANMMDAKTKIYAIISPLADQAEEVTLIGNPLREQILKAKQIFVSMEEIQEEYLEEKPNAAVIEASYNELEKQVAEARALTFPEDYSRQERYYGQFLDKVETFMGLVRKDRRDNKFTERAYKSLVSEYESTISRYNSFVN